MQVSQPTVDLVLPQDSPLAILDLGRTDRQDVHPGQALAGLLAMHPAWLLLDPHGLVVRATEAARRLLEPDVRIEADGALRWARSGERANLEPAFLAAAQHPEPGPQGILFLARSEAPGPLCLEVVSLAASGAVVVVRDLYGPARNTSAVHLLALGLTPAEARVAMHIGAGGSPSQVARLCKVSNDTVRTQLRAIFAKLGVTRQSELAVLVTRLECCGVPASGCSAAPRRA